jgi:DNA-binding transcriptional LysR family regulator
LKTALLHRTKRRVELTDAGRLFLEEARDIVARADRAAMIARRAGGTTEGRLRVGVGYCMDQSRISEAVSTFKRAASGNPGRIANDGRAVAARSHPSSKARCRLRTATDHEFRARK